MNNRCIREKIQFLTFEFELQKTLGKVRPKASFVQQIDNFLGTVANVLTYENARFETTKLI